MYQAPFAGEMKPFAGVACPLNAIRAMSLRCSAKEMAARKWGLANHSLSYAGSGAVAFWLNHICSVLRDGPRSCAEPGSLRLTASKVSGGTPSSMAYCPRRKRSSSVSEFARKSSFKLGR